MPDHSFTVTNSEETKQFEVEYNGQTAFLTYQFYKKDIAFMHTVVPAAMSGMGVATLLTQAAFAYAEKRKMKVMVFCPFVSGYIKKHTEYRRFLDPQYLG